MSNLGSTISNLLLPGLSIGSNAMGLIKANRDKKQAEAMVVPETDWRQQEVYDTIKQKMAAIESGSAYDPQRSAIAQQGLSAMNAATSVTGGDIGATIDALSKIQRGTGRTQNELFASTTQEGLQLSNLLSNVVKSMADRSYQVTGWEKRQALADAMKRKQQYAQNLTTAATDVFGGGLIESLIGGGKESGGGALSGAVSGAATGSVVPGIGTALGGIVGAFGGMI